MINTLQNYTYASILIALVIYFLIVAKNILVPIVLAFAMAYLISLLSNSISQTRFFSLSIPKWLTGIISFIVIVGIIYGIVSITESNLSALIKNTDIYQNNLIVLSGSFGDIFGIDLNSTLESYLANLPLEKYFISIAGAITSITGNVSLIIVYIIFMLLEYGGTRRKLSRIITVSKQRIHIQELFSKITSEVNTYLKVKSLASLLTGFLTFLVLYFLGVDFALFFGLVAFLLNYIPTVGSIIGAALPSLLALVQFVSFGKFFLVLLLLIAVQVIVGQVLEPRVAGSTLSLSPLIIIISLIVASAIWGVVGMLLAIPALIVIRTLLMQSPKTVPIALLLGK